ncbi:GNAT family N-acetyltransferase [Archangium violaceum]|uniref:GNAT family N-acetyltransferase n=1 Tax=Archangium violaceum TaxID=83451 RepID=UPI002B2BB721|nr:GNAT family N-acetyltransferase [Archangium violaceum]
MFSHKPVLRGVHAVLRPFRQEDIPSLWAMLHDPECIRFTGSRGEYTRESVDAWYSNRGEVSERLDLAIADVATDACLGEVVLNNLSEVNRSCGFRICLAGPHAFGRGLGTEATRLILRHAFETVGLHRVELEVYDFNPRARHVYEKAGFVLEGIRRQSLFWEGAWHDTLIMAVLAHEWAVHRGTPGG